MLLSRYPKRAFGLLFLLLSGDYTSAESPTASVFWIRSHTPEGIEANCSATLVRPTTQTCVLLTNFHCVGTRPRVEVVEDQSEVRVEKTFPRYDIATLSLNKALLKECQRLNIVQTKDYRLLGSFADNENIRAEGFVKGQRQVRRASGFQNTAIQSSSFVRNEVIGPLLDFDFLLRIQDLVLDFGMSGGLLSDGANRVLGLLARFIPTEATAFAVPWTSIAAALEGSIPATSPGLDQEITRLSAQHLQKNSRPEKTSTVGDNTHANGGDNVHANGGDNVHANGSDPTLPDFTKVDLRLSSDPSSIFREPDEGYPLEAGSSELLLSADGHQIDGLNDYITHFLQPPQVEEKITRRKDQDLAFRHRQDLLPRLDGVYVPNAGVNSLRRAMYLQNPREALGWKLSHLGHSIFQIDIDAKKSQISFQIGNHSVRRFGSQVEYTHFPALERLYSISENHDRSLVVLKSSDEELICRNRHYLKLICEGKNGYGETIWMSFSKNQRAGESQITFRRSRFMAATAKMPAFVDHFYGTLKGSQNAANWRKP